MPSPRRGLRSQRHDYSARQLGQLLYGIDWGPLLDGEPWSQLQDVTPEEMPAIVEDMLCCWRANSHNVTREFLGMNPTGDDVWFAQYVDNPQKLIDEATAERAYMQEQRRRGGWFPRSEMNTSAPAAPADAETT